MPAIDPSIPLGVKVPDTMSTIGGIATAAKGMQDLQTGAIAQRRQSIQLQQEQGDLDARKAVAAVISDPELRDPETGMFDLNRGAPAILQADPKNYHATKAISEIAKNNGDIITVKRNALGLAETSRALLGSTLGALTGNPNVTKADANSALDILSEQAPDAKPAINVWRRHLEAVPDDPRVLSAYFNVARNQAMPPDAQRGAMTPGGASFNTGAVSGVMNTNPGAGPPGPVPGTMMQNVVPPTAAEEIVTDAQGNRYRSVKGPNGVITIQPIQTGVPAPGAAGGAGGAAPPAPGPRTPPMMTLPPGESPQTAAVLAQERNDAKNTLSGAPVMHATNRGVLEEIDKATTGTLGPRTAAVMSALGVSLPKGWGGASAEEKASAYDLVGKYLERNAITAAQSMGPHTNAGLESQIKAQGSVAYNPTAIKKITQLNDALVSGAEHYQPGLEKAITESPNQLFAKRQYDQQWAQNFDPRVMMLYNAQTNGKPSEVQDLVKSWGGKDSATVKEILRKAKNLDTLSTAGHL